MLPQAKVDQLIEKIIDVAFDKYTTEQLKYELADMIDDALHDAYGDGRCDERKLVVAYLSKLAEESTGKGAVMAKYPTPIAIQACFRTARSAIQAGLHDPPDPAHLERCRKLIEGPCTTSSPTISAAIPECHGDDV